MNDLHHRALTWGALVGAAVAVGSVVFTAGDASQRLSDSGKRLDAVEARTAHTEAGVSDMRVTLAILSTQMNDIQMTVHHVDRSEVPRRGR